MKLILRFFCIVLMLQLATPFLHGMEVDVEKTPTQKTTSDKKSSKKVAVSSSSRCQKIRSCSQSKGCELTCCVIMAVIAAGGIGGSIYWMISE